MLLLLMACAPGSTTRPPSELAPPVLESVGVSCSPDADSWTFSARTSGWTAGGVLSMSLDGLYVEAHAIESLEADPDAAWDRLRLELEIEADPRDVRIDTSTAFLCDDTHRDGLAFRLVVNDPVTRVRADCAVFGQDLDWNAAAGYSACDKRLEPEG